MTTTVTYRFLGIPVWSVTRATSVDDKNALYREFADRFNADILAAMNKRSAA
jgi:hypothetical protein